MEAVVRVIVLAAEMEVMVPIRPWEAMEAKLEKASSSSAARASVFFRIAASLNLNAEKPHFPIFCWKGSYTIATAEGTSFWKAYWFSISDSLKLLPW